jgi:membrane-bound lytic murein transglycosylase B
MSSLAGMVEAQVASPASTTTGAAWSPPPGSSSFDQVFAAAVQQLRTQWGPQGAVAAWSGGAVGPQWTGPSSGVAGAASVAGTAGVAGVAGSVSPGTPYAALFEDAGRRHGIPPRVLAAIGWVESRFRLDAVSSAGALGMMQFLPGTAASMGVDPYDPASAIDGAARYLRHALDRFGSLEQAIASYNVGPGTIARAGGVQPGTQAERYLVNVIEATARI